MVDLVFDEEQGYYTTRKGYFLRKEAKAKKLEEKLALEKLIPLAEKLLKNPRDYDSRNKMDKIFEKSGELLMRDVWLDGTGDAVNLTYLSNGLVIESHGSSGNFRVDNDFRILTREQATERAKELSEIEKRLFD